MNTYSLSFKNIHNIWIYSILIIISVLAALFVVYNIKLSPDSMRFGLISEQIASGNGISVPIIRLEDTYLPQNGAIPFLDQMPLMPILLALLGGITPQSLLAGKIINVVSHVAIVLFTFLITRKIYDHKGVALFSGILVSIAFPLLRNAHHIWSEPLFIALTSASLYFLVLSRSSSGSRFSRKFLIAGICASASILTRNAGIGLIPVFLWEGFILLKNKKPESKRISTIFAIILPVMTSGSMFVRNYMVSGMLRGFYQPPPDRSFFDAFTGTVKMIFMQFQLGQNSFVLIMLMALLFLFYFLVNAALRKEVRIFLSSGLDSILVYLFCYTMLIVVAMAKQAWLFELRLVSPLVPFLFIIIVLSIVLVWRSVELRALKEISVAGMILSFGLILLVDSYKTYLNTPGLFYQSERSHSILQNCAYKWVKENAEAKSMIVTNRPFHLSFFGEYSTVALPHKRFDPNIHVPDDMERVLPKSMMRFGTRLVALFEKAEVEYEGRYIADLFNKRGTNVIFELVYDCSEGVVYSLKE